MRYLLVFFCRTVLAANRSQYFFIPFDRLTEASTIYFDVGENEDPDFRVTLSAAIDLHSREIFLEDSGCGDVRPDCAAYCNNQELAKLYCDGGCQQLAAQNLYGYCLKTLYTEYNATITGGQLLRQNWYRRMGSDERWFGAVFSDYFRFWGVAGDFVDFTENAPQIADLRFVSLLRWSARKFYEFSGEGLLGLAPGNGNFVDQLLKQRKIDRPVVSIAGQKATTFRRRSRPYRGLLTLGALDRVRCADWTFHQTRGSWTLVAEEIIINGTLILRNQIVAFSASHRVSQFPVEVFKFFHDGPRPCYSPYDIQIRIDGRVLFLRKINFYGEICQRYVIPIGQREGRNVTAYTTQPQWILGNRLFSEYCIGYDYDRGLLALGQNRFADGPAIYSG